MNSWVKGTLLAGAAGAAVLAGRAAIRRRRRFSFAGKTAIVMGGSRGLGLALARRLVDAGAKVAICARTPVELKAAEQQLRERGGDVLSACCDVRSEHQVKAAVSQVLERFGSVDLLFNVAGIIEIGPLDAMTRDDFRSAMDTNCWGALHSVLAVLPEMRRRGWGRIVNVASIGGKVAVPHMLPYCVSKFALVGLSRGLRTELAKDGILVTAVCPTLMRTGSPRNAVFKGQNEKEYAWFSIGDSLPMVAISAEKAAEQILLACQNGDGEVIIKNRGDIGVALATAFPELAGELAALANRLLPEMGGIGQRAIRGQDSQSKWSPSWLSRLGDRAAQENNEMGIHPIK